MSDNVVGALNEAQTEITQILRKNSLQLQKRIEDLLSFSLIAEKPKLYLARQPLRLDQLIKKVIGEHKVSLKAKNLNIDAELHQVSVDADAEKLDNLLSNAIKYSPLHERISIHLIVADSEVQLEVQDLGPGIPDEERDKIFSPFYQGRAIYGGHVKRTGLGLAIAQEYINAHGGNIEPINVAKGACMRVTLPIHAPETPDESKPAAA